MVQQFRAQFDATVLFANGGGLHTQGFRIDVPAPDVTEAEIAALFVSSLSLLMVEQVVLREVSVFPEAHKGTRGGPSDVSAPPAAPRTRLVELSPVVPAGTTTYDGPPDLVDRPLSRLVDLPAVVVRTLGGRARGVDAVTLQPYDVTGCAVLLHTGGDAPFLTADGAAWLAAQGAVLVGIDGVDIDGAGADGPAERPARTLLRAAGIPVVTHLTGLDEVPPAGASFTAAPPRIADTGASGVRAYAAVPAG